MASILKMSGVVAGIAMVSSASAAIQNPAPEGDMVPWDRNDPYAVTVDFDFTTDDEESAPDGILNNYDNATGGGPPVANILSHGGWNIADDYGVWLFPNGGNITLEIPNVIDNEPHKVIQIQFFWGLLDGVERSDGPAIDGVRAWKGDDESLGHHESTTKMEFDRNYLAKEVWLIEPNPDYEFIDISIAAGVFLDRIVVDTISIPAPAASVPIAIGLMGLARRRRN